MDKFMKNDQAVSKKDKFGNVITSAEMFKALCEEVKESSKQACADCKLIMQKYVPSYVPPYVPSCSTDRSKGDGERTKVRALQIADKDQDLRPVESNALPEPKTVNQKKLAKIEEENNVLKQQNQSLELELQLSLQRESVMQKQITSLKDQQNSETAQFTQVLKEYDETLEKLLAVRTTISDNRDQQQLLEQLQTSIADIQIKYESCKVIVGRLMDREKTFHTKIIDLYGAFRQLEDVNEALLWHADEQLKKGNEENEKLVVKIKEQAVQLENSKKWHKLLVKSLENIRKDVKK